MNPTLIRKIVYIALAAVLLLPLSVIARPQVRSNEESGGVLARMKVKEKISQSNLSEIDPASETMKLASLGLRGVAVNMLWMQAIDHKKKQNYDKLASTLRALTKIQPNFVKVWEYQAHNLAYNVSVEFDDYEDRYDWVTRGLEFLKGGFAYNRRDHRMTDMLGFMTGNKFGKSDEKKSFRRKFRKDKDFHQSLGDLVDPESYDVDVFGPDSWLLAYQWYDWSDRLVQQGGQKYKNDALFYMFRPAQIRHRGLSLQNEHKTDDIIQEVWQDADDRWKAYGSRELFNSLGRPFRFEDLQRRRDLISKKRDELDELAPGVRKEILDELKKDLGLTPEQEALLDLGPDQRTEEQEFEAQQMLDRLQKMDEELDAKIARQASEEDRLQATRLVQDIKEALALQSVEGRHANTVNYDFWRMRNEAEARDLTSSARRALYDAQQMRRRSIYDDEFDIDYVTKKKTSTKKGAFSLYLDAFNQWSEVFKLYPELVDSPLSDEIQREISLYQTMLSDSNAEWPDGFPLQWFIDKRWEDGNRDGLPTSEDLEERRTGRESDDDEESDGQGSDDQASDGEEKGDAEDAVDGKEEVGGEDIVVDDKVDEAAEENNPGDDDSDDR